ncbi:MAG: sigma 54-interacting transcriptional regulator [Acidobacteriia bacterium]|nr:sigma 54-interacting transcriptional regulator [Terriglobia bacterium]
MERVLNPRLIGIRGPVEGGVFALSDGEISIGRDRANTLLIEDSSISRSHCSIHKAGEDRFEIRDLGSRNGTAINGIPVSRRVLGDGDEIRLGECHFLFLLWDSSEPANVVIDEASLETGTFRQLPREAAEPLLDEAASVSASLEVLIRLGTQIHTARGTREIAQLLLETILRAIPAERGAVLLFDGAHDDPAFASSRDRLGNLDPPLRAFSEIVAQVRREAVGVIADGAGDPRERPWRVLAAPITTRESILGVIYLEGSHPGTAFENKHVELAQAAGGIAGMPFENARRLEWLESENRRLREAIDLDHDMIGAGPRMRDVFQFVAKVAPTDATILIRGESGTGKELVAQSIHRNSPRAARRFAAINCAALAESLLESELFGHEKGAFTGAMLQKKGKLEIADGGTLFLDEVGELPLSFQTKLLRVLQEREFERVGGTQPIRVDVRLIAATNRDLESAIATGAFRKDLYYRLNVVSLTMPPLRDHREDISLLARHFAVKHARAARRKVEGISPEALACLEAYDWPGNVRELENAVERAVVLGSTDLLIPDDLPEVVLENGPAPAEPVGGYYQTVREQKKRAILAALEQSGGRYTDAAKLLGVHPNYLHRLVRNLNLKEAVKKVSGA